MSSVLCVVVVAVLMCGLMAPQALLFVWRVVVVVDYCAALIGILLRPVVMMLLCPSGMHVATSLLRL